MSNFYDRDLSWLTFNGRVLDEAGRPGVPLLERIRFLSIFSSNLDEFYRVRIPVLKALQKLGKKEGNNINFDQQTHILNKAVQLVSAQQNQFGQTVRQITPELEKNHIRFIYNQPVPEELKLQVSDYFLSDVLAYLCPIVLNADTSFFPENNKLYFIIALKGRDSERQVILNIPSDVLPRFYSLKRNGDQYIFFLDDVVRENLSRLFPGEAVQWCYSFKITRDAELELDDEYAEELSLQLERQLTKRDFGLATRLLFEYGMPLRVIELMRLRFDMRKATAMEGGRYHNLKDLMSFPVGSSDLSYEPWPVARPVGISNDEPLTAQLTYKDHLIHTPYQSYQTVLRFFNEAASDPDTEEIYTTMYRVASDSRIVSALITAARNGKKVQVLVELKARFDEANNLKWAKRMKEAGVKIIYSVSALKVHAKIALVKLRRNGRMVYNGLLATGNFNESTAKFYTDHILLTANHALLRELELLFIFLARREKPKPENYIDFQYILVAQFNLQQRFLALIDREIALAKDGKPASIQIKLNNLEERVLINKLYEASQAGVKVDLIIRSICCLKAGVTGLSQNIRIKRIVDRYLEHGRVFVFGNDGKPDVYLGSADWMNRNIYHRIEVCFPVYDNAIKAELLQMMALQWADNTQAVWLDESINNIPVKTEDPPVRSQYEIYQLLKRKEHEK